MPTSVPGTPFDDGSEADLHDQETPATPDDTDPEDASIPTGLSDLEDGSEADLLEQNEEVELDEDELEPG